MSKKHKRDWIGDLFLLFDCCRFIRFICNLLGGFDLCEVSMIAVFDLDSTTIDSSHRQLTSKGGTVNLENWRTHTREQILKDKELPLASYMRDCISNPRMRVWICTSRTLKNADYEMLEKHGLDKADVILSRKEGDSRNDVEFKMAKIRPLLNLPQIREMRKTFFDDRQDIRDSMETLGFICPPPHSWYWYL